jgi:hypothetical protein
MLMKMFIALKAFCALSLKFNLSDSNPLMRGHHDTQNNDIQPNDSQYKNGKARQ